MPRVTDAYRRARRNEIAAAAMRCLRRKGVSGTSIADVVAESGLSAGAIYSHFRNKAELAAYIAGSMMTWRIEAFEESTDPAFGTPAGGIRYLLGVFDEPDVAPEVILQFWAEATNDPDLHAVMSGVMQRMRAAFAAAIRPWAEERAGADGAAALATRTASVMVALCQGYIANAALFGRRSVDDYLADAAVALDV